MSANNDNSSATPDTFSTGTLSMSRGKYKRQHRWTNEKTLGFLKIVDIYRPFDSSYGMVTEAWEKTAKEYNSSINEADALSGKASREYYKSILMKHRKTTRKSKKASGISEEVTELTAALDAAVELDDSLTKAAEENDKKKQTQVS